MISEKKVKVMGFNVTVKSRHIIIHDHSNVFNVGDFKPDAKVDKIVEYLFAEGFTKDWEGGEWKVEVEKR